ncbi:MAG: serine/threonine protein kinase [Planctomycetes bacterium]|nr:serine/threonine protein kinase [Planctomycetota bacterium]
MLMAEGNDRAVLAESNHGAGARLVTQELEDNQNRARLPDFIDRYRIIRELGRGGMGIVYEAEQASPRRRVALKVIRQAFASADLVRRFHQEAYVLGQLRHPGIAQIIEAGTTRIESNDVPYFTMELIEGVPFSRHAASLTQSDRIELLARVCDAVQHAHQKGVIHRDLKPANIQVVCQDKESSPRTGSSSGSGSFIDAIGQPKIMDFGIARLTDSDVQVTTIQTSTGQIVGTLGYMSPEQAEGNVPAIDTRCDVYALGVIMYHSLSGRLPHDLAGKPIAEAARIVRDEEPVRLSKACAVPGDLETIVNKAIERNPDRRYPTAASLADDLRRFLASEPISAHPPSAFYQFRKFAVRNKALFGGAFMTLVALLFGLAGTIWFAMGQRQAKVAAQRAGEESTRAAYRASLSAASAALREDDIATAGRHLESAPESLRGWEWRHLNACLDESLNSALITEGPRQLGRFDDSRGMAQIWFSEDGKRVCLASCLYSRELRVESRDANSLTLVSGWNMPGVDAFTAVGTEQMYVSTNSHDAAFHRIDSGEPCAGQAPVLRSAYIHAPLAELSESFELSGRSEYPSQVVVSPGSRWQLFDDSGVCIAPVDNRKLALALPNHSEGIGGGAFSPDGRFVVTAGNDRRLQCFDLMDGVRLQWSQAEAHTDAILAATYSPDGRLIASGGQDKVLRFWDAQTGAPRGAWMGHSEPILAIAISPSGDRVATASARRVKIWAMRSDLNPGEVWRNDWFVTDVLLSPDGSLLAALGKRGKLTLWEAWSCLQIASTTIPTPRSDWHQMSFATSGRSLILVTASNETAEIDLLNGQVIRPPKTTPTDLAGPNRSDPAPWKLASEMGLTASAALEFEGGRRVAIATNDRAIRIIDVETRRELGRLNGHTQTVTCLTILPGQSRLISGSEDRTIRLWDLRSMTEVTDLRGHLDRVNAIEVTPDGSTIYSASDDYTLRRWDTRTEKDRYAARKEYKRIARQLTPQIEALLEEHEDLTAAADSVETEKTLSDRERQVALQLLIRRSLTNVNISSNSPDARSTSASHH